MSDRKSAERTPGRGSTLTHFDERGNARMVDVSPKPETVREAVAVGRVVMAGATLERVRQGSLAKGDVLGVARIAAIGAVKETSRLIPLAHPLPVSSVTVDFALDDERSSVEIRVKVKVTGRTGVEMEALTGVAVAALTVYDMCKAVDREMTIDSVCLLEKSGGRTGHFIREDL